MFESEHLPILIAAIGLAVPPVVVLLSRYPMWGLYAYLFGASLLWSPNLPIVRQKLAVCDAVMVLLWLSLLLGAGKRVLRPATGAQKVALGAGIAWLLTVALAFVVNLTEPLFNITRASVETATYVYGFLVCLTVVRMVTTWEKWLNCLYAWVLGVMVVATVGLMATTIYAPPWTHDEFTHRLSSTLRESGQVASYCGPILPTMVVISASSFAAKRFQVLCIAFVGPTVITLLGAGSRIAFIIVVAGLLGLFIIRAQHRHAAGFNDLAYYLIAVMLVAGLGLFTYEVATDTRERYAAGRTSPFERPIRLMAEAARGERKFDDTRAEQFRELSDNFLDRPLFGTGPANYSIMNRSHEIHNSYLSTLAETGILGFVIFGIWIYHVCQQGLRGWRTAPTATRRLIALAFLYGFGLLMLYQMTTLGLRQRPFWFACGMMLALPRAVAWSRRPDHEIAVPRVHAGERDAPRHRAEARANAI